MENITTTDVAEAFAEEVARILQERGMEAEAVSLAKDNGVARHGVRIGGGGGFRPVYYVDGMPGRMSAGEAADGIAKEAAGAEGGRLAALGLRLVLASWDTARTLLRPVLVNEAMNEDLLAGIPHRPSPFEGIAECYEAVSGKMSCRVTDELARHWGASAEDLHEAAMDGAAERWPAVTMRVGDVLMEHGMTEDPELPFGFLVITTEDKIRGAAAVLQEGVLEGAAEQLGGSILLIPSSMHEFLVLGAGAAEAGDVNEIIGFVNHDEVAPEDVLAGHAYRYDPGTGAITAC